MAKKKKAKRKLKTFHNGKRSDALDKLYKAVCKFIDERGGTVVVIGGVQIIKWPGDGEYRFTLGIKITGKRPVSLERKE